uniref:Integrase, catalytic region, zinc finger, CCHC-type, peptidase aspartic, catalytic n=1 Tax=Tanacetum cinerariifolium TaxID=118510 RepID=A0A699HZM3_TANCI|nr:integrase, catalytic region, zinc finger, CCHC-type, peptidase aspartic, catalytic [Tanacetum cinerariifolium]
MAKYSSSGIFITSSRNDLNVDEQSVQDLALNVNNVFQADKCDAFDFDVDEAPTAQTMFMANLSSAYLVYDEVGPSYDSNILSEPAQYVSITTQNIVVDNSLSAERVTSKEQVELYERRANFKLTEREQNIDEQLRIVIINRHIKEEILKEELHSVKMQLSFQLFGRGGLIISSHSGLINPLYTGLINPLYSGLINTPHSGDAIIDFVNQLGYTEVIHFMLRKAVNNLYQLCREILSMINQCLTGKKYGHDRPSYPEEFTIFIKDQHLRFILLKKLSYVERRRLECKQPKSKPAIEKSSKPAPAPKSKATKERPSKASTNKPPKLKPAKEKSTKTTPPQKAGKGKNTKFRKVDTSTNIICDSPSPTDAETIVASEKPNNRGDTKLMQIDEEQGNDMDEQVNLKENTDEIDQGQARSDLGRTPESRPPPKQVVMDKDQARPDPRESHGALTGTP